MAAICLSKLCWRQNFFDVKNFLTSAICSIVTNVGLVIYDLIKFLSLLGLHLFERFWRPFFSYFQQQHLSFYPILELYWPLMQLWSRRTLQPPCCRLYYCIGLWCNCTAEELLPAPTTVIFSGMTSHDLGTCNGCIGIASCRRQPPKSAKHFVHYKFCMGSGKAPLNNIFHNIKLKRS